MAKNLQGASFDLEQITKAVDTAALIKQGTKIAGFVPARALSQLVPITRDPWKRIRKVENKLLTDLIPMRNQKMGADIFSFYRGTAELMAGDLKIQKNTGIPVVVCGDAHVGNYGFYASPERQLIFDLNDFDEAHVGHWENDLRRLLVSVRLAGSVNGFSGHNFDKLIGKVVKSYQSGINYSTSLTSLERYHFTSEVHNLFENLLGVEDPSDLIAPIAKAASKRTSDQVIKKYTAPDSKGRLRFIEDAPRTVHIDKKTTEQIAAGYAMYQTTVPADIALLLSQYQLVDVARHSVGVGSFGTRCYLLLLTSNDGSHLVLQVKEALPVRDAFIPDVVDLDLHRELSEGQRIISAQKILQTTSDAFIGYFNTNKRSFYVRQFRDMKSSVRLDRITWKAFKNYVRTCGFLLAFAHLQSPTGPMIKGYLDASDGVGDALVDWSSQYADQVAHDYDRFLNETNPE